MCAYFSGLSFKRGVSIIEWACPSRIHYVVGGGQYPGAFSNRGLPSRSGSTKNIAYLRHRRPD